CGFPALSEERAATAQITRPVSVAANSFTNICSPAYSEHVFVSSALQDSEQCVENLAPATERLGLGRLRPLALRIVLSLRRHRPHRCTRAVKPARADYVNGTSAGRSFFPSTSSRSIERVAARRRSVGLPGLRIQTSPTRWACGRCVCP